MIGRSLFHSSRKEHPCTLNFTIYRSPQFRYSPGCLEEMGLIFFCKFQPFIFGKKRPSMLIFFSRILGCYSWFGSCSFHCWAFWICVSTAGGLLWWDWLRVGWNWGDVTSLLKLDEYYMIYWFTMHFWLFYIFYWLSIVYTVVGRNGTGLIYNNPLHEHQQGKSPTEVLLRTCGRRRLFQHTFGTHP